MAVQGNLVSVTPLITTFDFISPIPTGDLIDPIIVTSIDRLSSPITNRFPVAPTAGGFLIDTTLEADPGWILPGPGVTRSITSILSPTLDVLEPTVGQIWPR